MRTGDTVARGEHRGKREQGTRSGSEQKQDGDRERRAREEEEKI